ncbi:MAG: PaaI family thioesterase [Evtepia sp.]|uniref:PaaI family thioesterase n=1 Tax=Evtepia sp. TaxID=2773933 RepID=UPI002A76505C|nr:PaaI family thioesterase [Evtepia sp.]MDY3014140.1 PaaI family thioesterase [Evtepia sp.]
MHQDLSQLKEKFIHDLFVSEGLGAVIDEASYGYARCSMEIEPRHCNALGIPMGGTVFTLADFAFAVASNQEGRDVVTQASQITFLKSARGKHLTATARQVKDGKRVCFYEVKVEDELGTEVAFVTVNGYVVRDRKAE